MHLADVLDVELMRDESGPTTVLAPMKVISVLPESAPSDLMIVDWGHRAWESLRSFGVPEIVLTLNALQSSELDQCRDHHDSIGSP